MPDYSFMRSGFSRLREPERHQWSAEDWQTAQAALLIFTEDSMVMAKQYAILLGHPSVTTQDVMDCLKAKTREGLATSPNMLARMQEYREMLQDSDSGSSSSSGGDEDESPHDVEEEDGAESKAEKIARSLDPEIASSYHIDENFVSRVQGYVESWDTWNPQTDVEIILKQSVNSTQQAFQM